MISNYELIVFDWDGTLVDSIDWIVECVQYASEQEGLDKPSDQACKDIIGLSLAAGHMISKKQKSSIPSSR